MFKSTSGFDKLLDKATSHLNLEEPDLVVTLQLNDLIRQKDVQASYAINALKKKLYDKNPNVQLFGLQVLESWVKNCGALVHDELLSSKDWMEELHDIVKSSPNEKVRKKILELIQVWAHAFRGQTKYQPVQDIMNIMRAEGYAFPQLKESDAMFQADIAPNWVDAEACMRCRSAFGLINRKHHCRACGKIFCDQCSRHSLALPHLGIEKMVRVCDYCYDKYRKPLTPGGQPREDGVDLPPEYLNSPLAKENQLPRKKTEEEIREEEELQLALALSQSESEAKNPRSSGSFTPVTTSQRTPTATSSSVSTKKDLKEDEGMDLDPELARYLDRSFWEKKQQKQEKQEKTDKKEKKESSGILVNGTKRYDEPDPSILPSAPPPASAPPMMPSAPMSSFMNGETPLVPELPSLRGNPLDDDVELSDFVSNLRSQLEIFTNRMESDRSRGRSIAVDSSVQTLFMNITSLHSTLIRKNQSLEESRVYFEGLQDRLTQIKDARAALDALREEHHEKIRREEEEAARQRQMQMAHKLAIMRKKKHEYLEYQRQMALQRMQEEERILTMKQSMGGVPMNYGPMPVPGAQVPGVMPGYPPNSMAPPTSGLEPRFSEGSPVHQPPFYAGAPPMGVPMSNQQSVPGMSYPVSSMANGPQGGFRMPPNQPPQQQQQGPQMAGPTPSASQMNAVPNGPTSMPQQQQPQHQQSQHQPQPSAPPQQTEQPPQPQPPAPEPEPEPLISFD